MIFRSIRFRIILWNIGLLAVSLIILGALAYNSFKFTLLRDLDNLLASRAIGVAGSIDTYWETEQQDNPEGSLASTPPSKIDDINFARITRHWIQTRSNDPRQLNMITQVFDDQGKLLVSSMDLQGSYDIPLLANAFSQQENRFDTLLIQLPDGKRLEARACTIPVWEGGYLAYIVRLITPLNEARDQLAKLRVILFGLLPLIILATGIAGAFLARISLTPVDQMIKDINRITSRNLRTRIDVPRSGDEIQRLAETFNAMLTRLDDHLLAQQRLIQDMSHEIKTPLTIMRGGMEVALKRPRPPERYEELLRNNLEEIERITFLVNNLLILARFDSHEMPLQMERVVLNDLVRATTAEAGILAEAAGIRIILNGTDPLTVDGDTTQLRSLFLNLLDNAVKYTSTGGLITVSITQTQTHAVIRVEDNGIGIGPAELPHIFERFFRAERSRAKAKGFGLGLSMARSIAESHLGTISAKSVAGTGSVFTVTLPL